MTRDDIMQIANDTAGAYWMDEAHIQRFAAALLAAEREACAKVCDEVIRDLYIVDGDASEEVSRCAAAIRARGQK